MTGHLYSLLIISSWLIIILTISLRTKNLYPEKRELSRKIIHIGTGPIIPIACALEIPFMTALLTASVITIALIVNYKFNLIKTIEDIERKSYGTIAYALSITLLIILFWSNNQLAICAGIMVMAFGDGIAGLVGRQMKSPSWLVLGEKKSVAGTFTMGLITVAVLIGINSINGIFLDPLQILAITLLAVALEQVGPWGIDNLTVPLGVGISWHLLSQL